MEKLATEIHVKGQRDSPLLTGCQSNLETLPDASLQLWRTKWCACGGLTTMDCTGNDRRGNNRIPLRGGRARTCLTCLGLRWTPKRNPEVCLIFVAFWQRSSFIKDSRVAWPMRISGVESLHLDQVWGGEQHPQHHRSSPKQSPRSTLFNRSSNASLHFHSNITPFQAGALYLAMKPHLFSAPGLAVPTASPQPDLMVHSG